MSKERFLTVLVPIKDSDCEATVYADVTALSTAVPPSVANINKVYKLQDGTYMRVCLNPSTSLYEYHAVTDREFPYLGNPLEIFDFTYDATRMGTAPTISAQGVMRYADSDGSTLDGLWEQQCHVVFNGKNLYLKQIPTSSKSNEDARYKYDMDFVDERVVLETVYFYDVVSPFVTERPISESSSFSFYGDIHELAKRINASLVRSGLANLTRKYVPYSYNPNKIVPYLTYEQWNSILVNPMPLIGDVFEYVADMINFRMFVYLPLNGDYNQYLMSYIYENTNGVYELTGYQCRIGGDKHGNPSSSEEKLITFENNTIHEALQQFNDTFGLVYYITCEKDSGGNFTGNTFIMVADCEHDFADWDSDAQDFVRGDDGVPISTSPFEYGDTEALLSKQKTNTTDKIVTRITGVGSSENIPWYYPNPDPDGWIKPFFTSGGVTDNGVTVDYPLDEGTTAEDNVRYEKFLKNRIGVPIKKGCVMERISATGYVYKRMTQPIIGQPHQILVQYIISSSKDMASPLPSMTVFLDYQQGSGCSSFRASLYLGYYKNEYGKYLGMQEVGTYKSWETYETPTAFQTMFANRDGGDILNNPFVGGYEYLLEIQYNIPYGSMPLVDEYDYKGRLYKWRTLIYHDLPEDHYEGGVYHTYFAYPAYICENFYETEGLLPYVNWQERIDPYSFQETKHFFVPTEFGYSIDGTPNGAVSPIPRRSGFIYKDSDTDIFYKCVTDDMSVQKDAFEANPAMDDELWIRRFVTMDLRAYINDGWYINGQKILLGDYGLGWPERNGSAFRTDIFDAIEFQRLKWLTPQSSLMPEVFVKTDGERRFYNAHNYWDKENASLFYGTADPMIGEVQVGGKVRNPIYKDEENLLDDKHYDFESEYRHYMPHEHIENFEDVKPTIEGQTNTVNGSIIRIDVVETFDYDATDNNEIWDSNEEETIQGDYKHPYFFAKLRPMGFNIFDLATTNDMVLSMTTGNCGACNFKIGVDEKTGKNPVQIWEHDVYMATNGGYDKVYDAGTLRRYVNLAGLYYDTDEGYVPVSSNLLVEGGGEQDMATNLYDRYTYSEESVEKGLVGGVKQEGMKHFEGDVVTNGRFLDSQQDTSENYVWVALMKDTESYGVIMPSAIPNYKDSTLNQYIEPKGIEYTNRATGAQTVLTEDQADKFVLTNIRLPQIYLRRAERKLSHKLVKYMYDNNWQRFNFSIKFSRIYIAGNPTTDDEMNENSVLYVAFNGTVYRQYAKHYTYKMSHDSPLPETSVDMNEDLSVSRTLTQQWDKNLYNRWRTASAHVGKVASSTREMAQKRYKGKYEDIVGYGDTSKGVSGDTYMIGGLEWGEF